MRYYMYTIFIFTCKNYIVYKRCDITYNTYSRPRLQSPTRVIYLVLIQQWRQVTVPVLYLTDIEYMRYLR